MIDRKSKIKYYLDKWPILILFLSAFLFFIAFLFSAAKEQKVVKKEDSFSVCDINETPGAVLTIRVKTSNGKRSPVLENCIKNNWEVLGQSSKSKDSTEFTLLKK